ncbi:MAG: UDP-N-acetylmuramate dehydrogenase [Aquificaceae bacterium]|nr:UDP-N-acetylmuramate dehydrogenase [Aquificaceae bacterium]
MRDVNLSSLTTIRIGGIAKYFFEPRNVQELKHALHFAKDNNLEVFFLGRGANTIFGDFDGFVISTRRIRGLRVSRKGNNFLIEAMAGEPLSEIVNLAIKENLEDLYKLAGFPATVGGAVAMNAGAFGYEISRHLSEVTLVSWDGEIYKLSKSEMKFSYRSSPFPEIGMVFSAVFEVPVASRNIREEHRRILNTRKEKQPINMPTCGSTFKNPSGNYAGRLLERVGMKGYRVGDVAFSDLHANFLVNLGNGTFSQVLKIIEGAKRRVFEEFGIVLEEEVRIVESGSAYGRKVCGA